MKFIKLTGTNNAELLVNIDRVTFIEPNSHRNTYVYFEYMQYVEVKERLSDIEELIEQEEKHV